MASSVQDPVEREARRVIQRAEVTRLGTDETFRPVLHGSRVTLVPEGDGETRTLNVETLESELKTGEYVILGRQIWGALEQLMGGGSR